MKREGPDVLVQGDFSPKDLAALLDAAEAAYESRRPRQRVVPIVWNGAPYRVKGSAQRLSVLSEDGQRYLAYRWSC